MADRVQNGTLNANELITVHIARHGGKLTVINRSSVGAIWVRNDGDDPVVEGENCFPVLPMGQRDFDVASPAAEPAQIKLIADGALDYSVMGTAA